MSQRIATLIGLSAILMWSLLALLTVATGTMPAFQLAAMTFAIGGAVGLLSLFRRSDGLQVLRQPLKAWAVGVGGLFGYHALYFLALRFAPPAEAGLLNYLWPLLITTKDSMQTIVIGIKKMLSTTDELAEWQLAMATAVLAMLPPVAVVVFMQRLFVKGLVETEK